MKKILIGLTCALLSTTIHAQNIDVSFVGSFVSGSLNGETILGEIEVNDFGNLNGSATPLPGAITDGSNGVFENFSITFFAPGPTAGLQPGASLPPTMFSFDLSNASGTPSASFDGDRLFGFTYAGSNGGATLLASYDATQPDQANAVTILFNDGNGFSSGTLDLPVGLTPVPEPSSYAALAGLLVLGIATIRRRF